MSLSQKPLDQDRDPIAASYDVIERTIAEYPTLQLSGLRILEMAVKHVIKQHPLHQIGSKGVDSFRNHCARSTMCQGDG